MQMYGKCEGFSLHLDLFFRLLFTDSTMGFITIFHDHLGEYFWIFSQLPKQTTLSKYC